MFEALVLLTGTLLFDALNSLLEGNLLAEVDPDVCFLKSLFD